MVTKQDVFNLLQGLGIKSGDTVLIHTSMRAIGGVEGGCDGLIDAFCEYLSEGLFIIPTHTWDVVDERSPYFDVSVTRPNIGALPTVAAFRRDGVRSLHPTHSVAAFGKRAAEYVKGEEKLTTPCPPDGCWGRLYSENAKILLIGVTLNRNTYIHAVDEMIELPGKLENPFTLTITDSNGRKISSVMYHHSPEAHSDNFDRYRPYLEEGGALSYAKLGNAVVYCCKAVECRNVIKNLWQKGGIDLA